MKKDRILGLDLFRIICILGVIFIHVSSAHAFDKDYIGIFINNYTCLNFYNMLFRFSVPGFLMISGMFLLKKNISIKDLFKRYILRIAIVYIIFASIYSIFQYYVQQEDILFNFLKGFYHLWYLYLIMGLYLIFPILKKISEDKKLSLYFLILCLIFSSILPIIQELINNKGFDYAIMNFNIYMPLGYAGYFLAGYYFSTYKTNKKIFYFLGLLGFIFNYFLFDHLTYGNTLYDSIFLVPGSVFETIALFLFFKDLTIKNGFLITQLSKLTFGVYLVHVLIMLIFMNMYPKFIYECPWITIPLTSIGIYIISLLISVTLNNIPLFKRLM